MTDIGLGFKESAFLREAATYLETPSWLMKVAEAVGHPMQALASRMVPASVAELGTKSLRSVMANAANTVASRTQDIAFEDAYTSSGWTGLWHRIAATVTGGVGGAFGIAGLAVELPVTTSILFRSIAAIASSFGEDLHQPEVRLECLTVFSHGGSRPDGDAMDASYITARVGLASLVRDAAQAIASQGGKGIAEMLARGSSPVLTNLLSRIAPRFNIVISQKFVAQSLPVIGIAAGAAVNNAFAGHFNTVARYHFGIRKLERQFGQEAVHAEYRKHLARAKSTSATVQPLPLNQPC
ncbi:MAG: EcsC family protein [Gemmataceae bacterium]|nr:EcsC family protein [Gemmataceae bacterium]